MDDVTFCTLKNIVICNTCYLSANIYCSIFINCIIKLIVLKDKEKQFKTDDK